jgi:hypothetical protein
VYHPAAAATTTPTADPADQHLGDPHGGRVGPAGRGLMNGHDYDVIVVGAGSPREGIEEEP